MENLKNATKELPVYHTTYKKSEMEKWMSVGNNTALWFAGTLLPRYTKIMKGDIDLGIVSLSLSRFHPDLCFNNMPDDYIKAYKTLFKLILNDVNIEWLGTERKECIIDKRSSFNQRLINAMNWQNLRQADLVQKTGLSKQRISQYVSGQFTANPDGVYALAQALDVNEAWLIGYDAPIERNPATKTEHSPNLSARTENVDGQGIATFVLSSSTHGDSNAFNFEFSVSIDVAVKIAEQINNAAAAGRIKAKDISA